nr:DUF5518 domain-containing protein [Methanobacterium formicicum]
MLSPIYSYGIYVGFLIGALLTGYMVGGTYVEGAKHGIVMGIITAIILGGVSMIFDLIFPREAPASIVIMGEMYALIITLIVCSAVGSILGGIGAEIKGYKFNMGKVGGEKNKGELEGGYCWIWGYIFNSSIYWIVFTKNGFNSTSNRWIHCALSCGSDLY